MELANQNEVDQIMKHTQISAEHYPSTSKRTCRLTLNRGLWKETRCQCAVERPLNVVARGPLKPQHDDDMPQHARPAVLMGRQASAVL